MEAAAIKLANRGVDPTERRLKAFAVLAAASVRDLDHVVEAVLDAAVCEYERLKELGIGNLRDGELITLSMRGCRLTVTQDSVSIVEAIAQLAELAA
jgi:hypothetical protein